VQFARVEVWQETEKDNYSLRKSQIFLLKILLQLSMDIIKFLNKICERTNEYFFQESQIFFIVGLSRTSLEIGGV
jgi:hypothetical protein